MSAEDKRKCYRSTFQQKYLKLVEHTKSLLQAYSAKSKSSWTTRNKMSSLLKSMLCKRWPSLISCHYIKDSTVPPETLVGLPIRVVIRVRLLSDSLAAQVISMAKNFDGVKKVEKWSGGNGLVVVGILDSSKLQTWIEAVTGLDTKVVLVSAKVALKEVWFKIMLQSAIADKMRLVVLGLKGVEDVSLTPLGNSMHLFKVRGDVEYSKLLSIIDVVHSFYHQSSVSAHEVDDQATL